MRRNSALQVDWIAQQNIISTDHCQEGSRTQHMTNKSKHRRRQTWISTKSSFQQTRERDNTHQFINWNRKMTPTQNDHSSWSWAKKIFFFSVSFAESRDDNGSLLLSFISRWLFCTDHFYDDEQIILIRHRKAWRWSNCCCWKMSSVARIHSTKYIITDLASNWLQHIYVSFVEEIFGDAQ